MANVALIELLLGRPEAALEHGRAAVAQIDALGAGGTIGHGRGHLYWAVRGEGAAMRDDRVFKLGFGDDV